MVIVGGWGEEKRKTKGNSGTVRNLSCPNCKENATLVVSGLGLRQQGETQNLFFFPFFFSLWVLLEQQNEREKIMAQEEFREKEMMKIQE